MGWIVKREEDIALLKRADNDNGIRSTKGNRNAIRRVRHLLCAVTICGVTRYFTNNSGRAALAAAESEAGE